MSSVTITVITDDERYMFDSLWEFNLANETSHVPNSKHLAESSQFMLDSFIEMLSTKYDFDIHKFVINDEQGKLVHQRMPRVQRSKDLVN